MWNRIYKNVIQKVVKMCGTVCIFLTWFSVKWTRRCWSDSNNYQMHFFIKRKTKPKQQNVTEEHFLPKMDQKMWKKFQTFLSNFPYHFQLSSENEKFTN